MVHRGQKEALRALEALGRELSEARVALLLLIGKARLLGLSLYPVDFSYLEALIRASYESLRYCGSPDKGRTRAVRKQG